MADWLERLWDRLLSREPDEIRAAFASLSTEDQQVVQAHLRRMVTEPGWLPEQQASAQAALDALQA